jgi:hypothetical protein
VAMPNISMLAKPRDSCAFDASALWICFNMVLSVEKGQLSRLSSCSVYGS